MTAKFTVSHSIHFLPTSLHGSKYCKKWLAEKLNWFSADFRLTPKIRRRRLNIRRLRGLGCIVIVWMPWNLQLMCILNVCLFPVAVLRWGQGAQLPPILHSPPIFGHSSSATGWINWFYSKFRLAVVASQMMRGQAPKIFFPRTALPFSFYEFCVLNKKKIWDLIWDILLRRFDLICLRGI